MVWKSFYCQTLQMKIVLWKFWLQHLPLVWLLAIKVWTLLFIMGYLVLWTIRGWSARWDISSTLSWRRPLSYRNQFIDLQSKSMDWFLCDNGLRHEKVAAWVYSKNEEAFCFRNVDKEMEMEKRRRKWYPARVNIKILHPTLHKKWSFPLGISSVNVTNLIWFGHIYWRNS